MLVKGYKGMRSDMTCRGMQYEIGKTYHAEGDIKLCCNGFHFCRRLMDVFLYYDRWGGNRFFEVEAEGVEHGTAKSVAATIRIIRELSAIEVLRGRGVFGDGNGWHNGGGNGDGSGYSISDGCGEGDGKKNGDGKGNGNGDASCFFTRSGNGHGNSDGWADGGGFGDGNGYCQPIHHILIFE